MTDSNFNTPTAGQPGQDDDSMSQMDNIDELLNYEPGQFVLSQEDLDKQLEKKFEDFYRRVYPGFTLSSGLDTMGHGRAELCLTTDTAQALHFYEQGNCKLGSRKSIELRTGDKATSKDVAVTITSENGHVVITAPRGNLVLQGENVLIETTADDGQLTMKSSKNLKIDSPIVLMESNNCNLTATSQMLLYGGGDCLVYSEAGPVETGAGMDPIVAQGLVGKIIAAYKNAKAFFASGG